MTNEANLLDQMLRQIQFYRTGELSLSVLIGDLVFLSAGVAGQCESWKRSVEEKVGDLEQVNAVMLDRGAPELDETGRIIVERAVNELVSLIDSAKKRGGAMDAL